MNTGKMGYLAREAAAKARREENKVDPAVREARARMMEEREAALEAQRAAEKAAKEARPDAITTVLLHASLDELHEFQRSVGQLDGRRMSNLVADVIRRKQTERLDESRRRASGAR